MHQCHPFISNLLEHISNEKENGTHPSERLCAHFSFLIALIGGVGKKPTQYPQSLS